MDRKGKAPNRIAAGRGFDCGKSSINCQKNITPSPKGQPIPGTALAALLKKYRFELDAWHEDHGDRHSQGLIDCCNVLLNAKGRDLQ